MANGCKEYERWKRREKQFVNVESYLSGAVLTIPPCASLTRKNSISEITKSYYIFNIVNKNSACNPPKHILYHRKRKNDDNPATGEECSKVASFSLFSKKKRMAGDL